MTRRRVAYMTVLLAALLLPAISALAADDVVSEVGTGGYDVVAYFEEGRAVRGTGWHAVNHEGTAYLFSSEENRDRFVEAPDQYLPEFGGYCAFGVAVGKKFYADPTVWKIVDGKLYLNLDKKIQKKWQSDLSENLKKGYANWPDVKDASPEGL